MTYPCPTPGFNSLSQANLPALQAGVCAGCGKWVRATRNDLRPWKHRGKKIK